MGGGAAGGRSGPRTTSTTTTTRGRPLHGEAALYERLTLEAFQSGLSWLRSCGSERTSGGAFDGFEVERVADYGNDEVARLLGDAGIVRNRKKIEAAITNAKAARRCTATARPWMS